MSHLFNGVLEQILERYPNIDVAGFLMEKLDICDFKAEELAARIEKEYCQKATAKTEQNLIRNVLSNPDEDGRSGKPSAYSFDCLSEREFAHFIKWLFEELGYEIQPGKSVADGGLDFVAVKDGEKIAVKARRTQKTSRVPNPIILKSEEAKRLCECEKSIVVATSYFSKQAVQDAQRLCVELWDRDTLAAKIAEVKANADLEEQSCFPPYKGSLLQSLLRLEETKDFLIEVRADEKYDLHLPGVKFPLLTFLSCGSEVVKCVFRIRFNEPVGEFDGEALVSAGCDGERVGPDDAHAYALVVEYLEQFAK
jgi:hypothetical protein